MTTASSVIYPGTFDPLTNGHLDIIVRSAAIFPRVWVAVANSPRKNPLFSLEERVELARRSVAHLPNVEVFGFSDLLVKVIQARHISAIIRGVRTTTDFEYELQLAQTNKIIAPNLETVFLSTNLKYSYLSSSIVKEIAVYDGDISHFVREDIRKRIMERLREKGLRRSNE